MLARFALATLVGGAAMTAAQSVQVTIEASHGGAGSDLTNTTIQVPLNTRYTNSALDVVSSLFLTSADGVALDSVTCTPYRYNNLTGNAGLPFTSSTPSFLSTNTVQVGSLLCSSSGDSTSTSSSSSSSESTSSSSSTPISTSSSTPPPPQTSTPIIVSPTSSYPSESVTSTLSATSSSVLESTTSSLVPMTTSTPEGTPTVIFVTTVPGGTHPVKPTTITSVEVVSGSNGETTSTVVAVESSTSSAPPSLNTDSAGGVAYSVGWKGRVAMAGMGLAVLL